jgi:hypothetical protein
MRKWFLVTRIWLHSVFFILNHFCYNMDTKECSYVTGITTNEPSAEKSKSPCSPGYKPPNTPCVMIMYSEEIFFLKENNSLLEQHKNTRKRQNFCFLCLKNINSTVSSLLFTWWHHDSCHLQMSLHLTSCTHVPM